MDCSVNRKELVTALTDVAHVTSRHTTIPILDNVRLSANGRLVVETTDQEIGLRKTLDCQSAINGETTVNAKQLLKLVKGISADRICLQLAVEKSEHGTGTNVTRSESHWITVAGGRSTFKITGIDAKEFPCLPGHTPRIATTCEVSAAALRTMLKRVDYAMSTDETRLNLSGCYFEVLGDVLSITATDGHRLAQQTVPVDCQDVAGIVPRKAVTELARMAAKGDGSVTLALTATVPERGKVGTPSYEPSIDGTFTARRGDAELCSRLVEGTFPDYHEVIPQKHGRTLTVDSAQFQEALARCGLIASDRTHLVRLDMGDLGLVLSSRNPDLGDATEIMPAELNGAPLTVGYNAALITDTLSELPGGMVTIQFAGIGTPRHQALRPAEDDGSISPAVIVHADAPGFLCVVMPMKL